jgi:glycosyltransferase involved in cell wall biosynthesis
MRYIKSINPRIKTAIIVPDIPELTFRSVKNPFKRIKNYISIKFILKTRKQNADKVDGWILFSQNMVEKIPQIKNSMVFEGVATDLFSNIEGVWNKKTKDVLYAGGLNENYGVKLLLDAFSLLKGNEWRLIIAGRGPLEEYIKQKAEIDKRIIYKGEIPRPELLSLEKNSDCLVNPRINSGIFTRYSFPSKNMEFLSSGVPMVGFKLDGIPNEYDQYINYFKKATAKDLAEKIVMVCNSETYRDKAEKARDFVLHYKNKTIWADSILKFILSCNGG